MKSGTPFAVRLFAAVAALTCLGLAAPVFAEIEEDPDCSEQLQQVPRDGSTLEVTNPWLTVSGNLAYSGLDDVEAGDVRIADARDGEAFEAFELEAMEADSHVGIRIDELPESPFEWSVGEGPEAMFGVHHDAEADDRPPTIGDGDVEASMDLTVYEEFPVMFRHWELSFPAGDDESTHRRNMRYLIEFTPEADDEPSDAVLVTPQLEVADDDRIAVELGGRTDRCNHAEPGVSVTDVADIEVWAVDLAGNVSDEPAVGTFEGVSEGKLAEAHRELNRIVERIEEESDDEETQTTEEIAEGLEDEEDEQEDGGCSAVGGGAPVGVGLVVVVLLGLGGVRRGPSEPAIR